MYYEAKSLRESNREEALIKLNTIITHDQVSETRTIYGFKALKQKAKLLFKHREYDEALETYETILSYGEPTRRTSEITTAMLDKASQSVLSYVQTDYNQDRIPYEFAEAYFSKTLAALKEDTYAKSRGRISLRLARIALGRSDYSKVMDIVRNMAATIDEDALFEAFKHSPKTASHVIADFDYKCTTLLELYALEIEIKNVHNEFDTKVQRIYAKSQVIGELGFPHPRAKGVLAECAGKILLAERKFESAKWEFDKALRHFGTSAESLRVHPLRYILVCDMFLHSAVDIFASQENHPFLSHHELRPFVAFTQAFIDGDLIDAQRIYSCDLLFESAGDSFLRPLFDSLLQELCSRVLVNYASTFSLVSLDEFASQYMLSVDLVLTMALHLIARGVLNARVDGVSRTLIRLESYLEPCDVITRSIINAGL